MIKSHILGALGYGFFSNIAVFYVYKIIKWMRNN